MITVSDHELTTISECRSGHDHGQRQARLWEREPGESRRVNAAASMYAQHNSGEPQDPTPVVPALVLHYSCVCLSVGKLNLCNRQDQKLNFYNGRETQLVNACACHVCVCLVGSRGQRGQ